MIDCELFIEKFYSSASNIYKNDVKGFINNLDKLIGSQPWEKALVDKQLMCSSFYLQRTANGISRSHYQKIKSYLVNLYNFLGLSSIGAIPSRAEVINSQETSSFFPSLNALLLFIDKIGTMTLKTCDTKKDLARIKSVCVLGWLGLSIKEIADLKKTDLELVHTEHSAVYNEYKIKVQNRIYYALDEAFAPLFHLQAIDFYNGLPSGKKVVFKGDESYLFRATNDADCHDGNAIKKIIQRFDFLIPLTEKKSIVFRSLNKNRLFIELYNYEQSMCINEDDDRYTILLKKIMSLMNCDRFSAYTHLEQYRNFSMMLRNNKL